jgi:hypothetical protein
VVSYSWWIYVAYDLSDTLDPTTGSLELSQPKPVAFLTAPGAGAPLDTAPGDATSGLRWLRLGGQGLTLAALTRLRLELGFLTGHQAVPSAPTGFIDYFPSSGIDVYVAGAQLTRSAEPLDFVIGARANELVQAGNAHLLQYGRPSRAYEGDVVDRARADRARYGDQPIVAGADTQVVAPELGIDARLRLTSATPEITVPGQTAVTWVEAPDPVLAAQLKAAAPEKPRTLTEILRGELAAQRGGAT